MDWKKVKEVCFDEKPDRHALLMDNLEAQIHTEFRKAVDKLPGIVWYGLPNAKDLSQPVDVGYAQVLTTLIRVEHRDWLNSKNNAD